MDIRFIVIDISEIADCTMFHEDIKYLSIFKLLWMNFRKEGWFWGSSATQYSAYTEYKYELCA